MRCATPAALKLGGWLQVLAALIWIPQAGLIAYAIGLIAQGEFDSRIYMMAAGVFVLGIIRSYIDAKGARLAYISARQTLSIMREKAFLALASRSPLDATRPASGEAASVLSEQSEMVVPYFSKFVPVRMRVMIVPLVLLVFVLWFSWVAALVLFIAAPLIPIFMALVGLGAQKASQEQLVEMGSMNGFLLDRLRGLATIRNFHAVEHTAIRLRENADNLRRKTMAVLRIAFLSSAVLELFSALGVAMVAVYVGFHLLGQLEFGAWGDKLTLAQAMFVLMLAPAFFDPLKELSVIWHDRASGEAAIDALEKLSQHGSPVPGSVLSEEERTQGEKLDVIMHDASVRLDHISFTYPGGITPFSNFSLEIASGEHVAILAPSGVGKSTLLALMAGLVSPSEGVVRIGGNPLDDHHAASLRRHMAWVGQKPHIFAGSARTNMTLGRKHVDRQQLDNALHGMALAHVEGLAENRALGESGTGISGGEALRLALVRAALNPQADIIFADEPTAHLDRETAHEVTRGLLALAEGKTLIVATHDAVLAQSMDRIIRLDQFDEAGILTARRSAL